MPRPRPPGGAAERATAVLARRDAPARGGRRARPRARSAASRALVVVGASAGGLEPLRAVLGALPAGFHAPIVVVMHRDAKHGRGIVPVLQRETSLRVTEARNGERLRPGVVYLAPRDRHVEVRPFNIVLTRTAPVHFSRPAIDILFRSAAKACGAGVTALVLSGMGRDGADGVRAVKAAGGIAVVQSPATAAHRHMPEAAIAAGAVAAVLPPDRIPGFLAKSIGLNERGPAELSPKAWAQLLTMLRGESGIDFGRYQRNALARRLDRRMLATGQRSLTAYLRYVRAHPAELRELHSAFLIKVSSFFRDPAAWRDLEAKVLRPLGATTPRRPLRAWCVGCATGEEAYSLAIATLEALPPKARGGLRVFATDVDERALAVARKGLYTAEQVKSVSPARLREYFQPEGAKFRVRKSVRDRVVFGRHDVTADPPLASLDVISCRNVLIYFGREVRAEVLRRFREALRPEGTLFLGRSEGPPTTERQLRPLSAHPSIYRKAAGLAHAERASSSPPVVPPRPGSLPEEFRAFVGQAAPQTFEGHLLDRTSVVAVGLDAKRRVAMWSRGAEELFKHRGDAVLGWPFLKVAAGLPLDRLARALRECATSLAAVRLRDVVYAPRGRATRWLDVELSPLVGRGVARCSLLFVATDVTAHHESESHQVVASEDLRHRLADEARGRQELADANEELSTLNEELQSTAEEQQTLNEELQSRNEELETLNEELQSANEELASLGDTARSTAEQAEESRRMIEELLDLSEDVVIMCDGADRVLLWSNAGTRLFRVSASQAIGQDLFELLPALDTPALRASVRQALRKRPSARAPVHVHLPDGKRPLVATVASSAVPAARSAPSFAYVLRIVRTGAAPARASARNETSASSSGPSLRRTSASPGGVRARGGLRRDRP